MGSDFCEKHDVALGDVMDVLKTLVSSGKIMQEDSDLFLAVISGKTRKDSAAHRPSTEVDSGRQVLPRWLTCGAWV